MHTHTHTKCKYPHHRHEELSLVEQTEEAWVPLLLADWLSPMPAPQSLHQCRPLGASASQELTESVQFTIQGLYTST